MATTMPCLHHQYGHCKYGSHCRNQHTVETCSNYPCLIEKCSKRHPRLCKFFLLTGLCRFNKDCSLLHLSKQTDQIADLEKEIGNLRQEVRLLSTVVKEMKQKITEFSTTSKNSAKQRNDQPETSRTCSISMTEVETIACSSYSVNPSESERIP